MQDVNGELVVNEDANAFQVKDQDGFKETLRRLRKELLVRAICRTF